MQTYILTDGKHWYCGKTDNLTRRLEEHKADRWKNMVLALVLNGDREKEVKRAGVEFIFVICMSAS